MKMDNMTLKEEKLEKVGGGAGFGAGLPIDSENPRCPDDECQLLMIHFETGFDLFQCRICGKMYKHLWEGDVWIEA